MLKSKQFKFIALAAAALVLIGIVCFVLLTRGQPDPQPSGPVLQESTAATEGSDATNATNATDATESTEMTDPTGTEASDPTEPSSDPTDPTEETVLPTVGPPTETTAPEQEGPPDDFVPTLPPDHTVPTQTKPAPEPVYNFDGATPSTFTLEQWNGWDMKTKMAFCSRYKFDDMTVEERHRFEWVTQYNCYTCGFEGHACNSQAHHDGVMRYIEKGCLMCGRHDCPCLLALNEGLWTEYDYEKCPYYDIKKDPSFYCQVCGYPGYGFASAGEIICERVVGSDGNCPNCGELIHVGECHHCAKK